MKHKSIYNRLRRIEGQVRGIEEMVASDKDDFEILIQLEAAHSSLSSTIASLIEDSLDKNESGEITLSDRQAKSILRLIKKS